MKRIAFLLLVVTMFTNANAQIDIKDSVLSHYKRLPQEKVYLHTDKPYYAAGDTIWFRAHVADAVTNTPVDRSKFVYVELLDNAADTLIERAMIKCDSNKVFANALLLPKALRSGKYTLAAYTRWMMNFDKELFFYKQVPVLGKGGDGGLVNKDTMTDEQKMIAGDEGKSDVSEFSDYLTDISMSLMPEGGHLIDGCRQRLAFKVIGNDGYGRDVRVRLVNAAGDIVAEGESEHLGMGYIYVTPKKDEQMTLEAYAAGGLSCSTPLPEVLAEGATIAVEQHGGQLLVQLIASEGYVRENLTCVVYGSGNLLVKEHFDNGLIRLDATKMKSGVVNVALVEDTTGEVLAERLVFVKNGNGAKVKVEKVNSESTPAR